MINHLSSKQQQRLALSVWVTIRTRY